MKKNYIFILSALILLMPFVSNGQAKKLIMFEHFTQASCGPCAAQNPAFQAVYVKNKQNCNHVAYHTSWPGVDPMNAANKPEVQSMVDLYAVGGVPDMEANGVNIGSPTAVTQALIDQAGSSPIRIFVKDTSDGSGLHNVHVKIVSLTEVPAATYILRAMVAEEEVVYATPPGSNGEKEFPNVFRKFINPAGAVGDAYVPAAVGDVVEYDFSYTVAPTWVEAQIYPIVYVQNTATKEIIQSGTSRDELVEGVNVATQDFQKGDKAVGNDFAFNLTNLSESDVDLNISIQGTWPADWSAYVTINGNTYNDGDAVTVPANSTINANFHAVVGATAGIGDYSAGVLNIATQTLQSFAYTVISGVTDLLVVTDNLPSSGTVDLKKPYDEGLVATGELAYGSLGHLKTIKGFQAGALDEIKHIYYSVGWTFPAMTDEMVGYFQNFMDNGGNIMIAGQDVNWDLSSLDASAHGSATTKAFMQDYFNTNFVNDGETTSVQFKSVDGDGVYDGVASSGINKSYGATYFYPDQLSATGPEGYNIFSYGATTKYAGVRSHHDNFKTVNLGIGLEMIALKTVSDEIMKRTYEYFHGIITGTQFDNYLSALGMGQNYPNPADQYTVVEIGKAADKNLSIKVTDLNGRTVLTQEVAQGSTQEILNTQNLSQGIYQYFLSDGSNMTAAKKLVVIH